MKKYMSKYLFLLVAAILFFACEDENTPSLSHREYDSTKAPVVSLSNISTKYGSEVYAAMKTDNAQGLDILQQGILLSDDQSKLNITQATRVVAASNEAELQQLTFSGLKAETTYYLRSYSMNKEAVGYGEIQQVTTGKAWERSFTFKEDFTTTSCVQTLATFQFGTMLDRGWTPVKTAGNFYDPATDANPFGDAAYVFCSESYTIFDKTGDVTDADNLLEFVADFTDGMKPQVAVKAASFGAPPINNAEYWDSYQVIASLEPITTVEEANAADVIAEVAVSEATTCQKVTFDLDDKYAGKVVYIGIRHKYSAEGYTLLIHYVDATALFEPIA